MRKIFFQTLENISREQKNVFLLTADLGIKFAESFKKIDPQGFINVGVAEANMIGIASGLAMSGKNVYCYSIIPFLTMRTFEQIRIDICYNNLAVKLLGAGGGLVYGAEGVTHHAIEDIAIMRSLPNMTVVAPGDSLEAQALAKASVDYPGPLYVRFGRDIDPLVHQGEIDFKIGKGIVLEQGKDICLLATGGMLSLAKTTADLLKEKEFFPSLVSLHTIKPLDQDLVLQMAKTHQALFTLEDHNIIGGLGGAVAETLAEAGFSGIFRRIGVKDRYTADIGGPDWLLEKMGLKPENMAEYIIKELKSNA